VFISIALELALTMIVTTALISAATFFLGFGALDATSSFARQTLDLILGNCVKLLGIYLVVAAGSQTITAAVSSIPASIIAFDPYAWIVAVVLLFWMVAKHLPPQMARIVSGSVLDSPHTNAAAMALATIRYAELATSAVTLGAQMTDRVAQGISHLAGHPVDSQSADYFQSANRQPTTSSEVEQSSSTTLTAPHSKPKDIT
jgi:type IV secretory pathway TrbL component